MPSFDTGVQPTQDAPDDTATPQPQAPAPQQQLPTGAIIESGTDAEVKGRFVEDIQRALDRHAEVIEKYTCLALLEPVDSIDAYDLNRIFGCLKSGKKSEKDVLLIILSNGGSVEPAYQISKLCKSYAKEKFVVVVPRQAKSAATLIALGADEIHIGPLGQLGPIDPQLGDLPALGVNQALRTIAEVAQDYPGSAEMFAAYLHRALTVEQIGYCNRISESAEQYALRLLSTKQLGKDASEIARELVHEYKDHSFVIDLDEARQHLGEEWVLTDTPELDLAESIFNYFDVFNFLLGMHRKKHLLVLGDFSLSSMVLRKNRR